MCQIQVDAHSKTQVWILLRVRIIYGPVQSKSEQIYEMQNKEYGMCTYHFYLNILGVA